MASPIVVQNEETGIFHLAASDIGDAELQSHLIERLEVAMSPACTLIGDLARDERVRARLHAPPGLLSAALLAQIAAAPTLSAAAARAVANLAFDTASFARACIADKSLCSRLQAALDSSSSSSSSHDVALRRATLGALSNIVAGIDDDDNDDVGNGNDNDNEKRNVATLCDERVLTALRRQFASSLASTDDAVLLALSLQLAVNLAQSGAARDLLRPLAPALLALAGELLPARAADEPTLCEKLVALLSALLESGDAFVEPLLLPHGAAQLPLPLALVRTAALPPASEVPAEQEDDDVRYTAAATLLACAGVSDRHRVALQRGADAAQWRAAVYELLRSERVLHRKVRPTLAKCLAEISLADALGDELLDGGDLTRLLDAALVSAVPDVRVAAALAVGNVARSDERAARLLGDEHRIVERLLELSAPRRDVAPDVRIPHATVGALQNIAVAPRNKAHLGQHAAPLFARLGEWLAMPNAHVQFAVALFLRALAADRQCREQMQRHELVRAVALVAGGAGYVQDDSAGTMTVEGEEAPRHVGNDAAADADPSKPRDMRVQYECARTLARLVAEAGGGGGASDGDDGMATLVAQAGGAAHLDALTRTKFVVLQAEGLVALAKLAAVDAAVKPVAVQAAQRVLDADPVAQAAAGEASAPSAAHHQAELRLAQIAVGTARELLLK